MESFRDTNGSKTKFSLPTPTLVNQRNNNESEVTTKELPLQVNQALLRPTELDEFVGQDRVKRTLGMLIRASQIENAPLPHILMQGPAGHGKTTLSLIAASMTQAGMIQVLGPQVNESNELTRPLLMERDSAWCVFFIDEVHRLKVKFQETLYPVMEDFKIHEISRYGQASQRSIKPFALIGATTNPGALAKPFRDRFQLTLRLEPYTLDEMSELVQRSAKRLSVEVEEEAEIMIAKRCRNSPRQANNILAFCRRVALVHESSINKEVVDDATQNLGIDELGLTHDDRFYLETLSEKFDGGPTGIKSISAASDLDEENISGTIEPHLLEKQLIDRTPKGRKITSEGILHIATHLNF